MSQKISKSAVRHASSHRAATGAAKQKAKPAPARFGDEMSTGRGSALRASARKAVSSPSIGADYLSAFDAKIAQLKRDVAAGKPGAQRELAAVIDDRQSVQAAVAAAEQQLAANDDPTMVAELSKKLADVKAFGVKVAGMNPTERQNTKNFFRMAKEDPEGLKRFLDAVKAQQPGAAQPTPTASAEPTAPVQPTMPTATASPL